MPTNFTSFDESATVYRISGYQTSTDYEALWKLAHRQVLICFIDGTAGVFPDRDLCETLLRRGISMLASVTSTGN